MLLDSAIERLYDLRVNTTPVEKGAPHHKPCSGASMTVANSLAAALPMESQTSRHLIPCTAPFRYLAGDGFWQAFEGNGSTPINREIRVADIGQVFARFTDGFQYLVAIPANRQLMREALMSRYFPNSLLIKNHQSSVINRQSDLQVAEEPLEYGRSPAFRRKILAIYDHQCAACGLRIKLPAGNDVSFIDAAHLIPFSESQNDHPTNGLALCKNHHWAMDRNLIAPCPDHHWHVSKVLDPRRSNGEKELFALSGQILLLPHDEAFHPNTDGLKWRFEQLVA